MRYANCQADGAVFVAEVDGDVARPLANRPPMTAGTDFAALGDARRAEAVALADVELLAPVLAPQRIICLGLNYRGHVTETKRELPTYPVLFTKFADALIGARAPIVVPPESTQVDYEAELAVVIGRPARRVAREDAMDVVAGFTVANDVTMRDYQYKSHQWLQGKAWPRSTPLGPWLATPDEVGDGGGLEIRLERNGQELQHSNTRHMIFDVPTTVATLSEFVNLAPGDVILMGTPDGVGFRREPKVLLEPGDRVRVDIERIGALENPVVAEDVRGVA
jgi:acylpyruvate hydrolase